MTNRLLSFVRFSSNLKDKLIERLDALIRFYISYVWINLSNSWLRKKLILFWSKTKVYAIDSVNYPFSLRSRKIYFRWQKWFYFLLFPFSVFKGTVTHFRNIFSINWQNQCASCSLKLIESIVNKNSLSRNDISRKKIFINLFILKRD